MYIAIIVNILIKEETIITVHVLLSSNEMLEKDAACTESLDVPLTDQGTSY